MSIERIGILGAGAWGTALGAVMARSGLSTTIWALEGEVVTAINETHENPLYLKDVPLPDALTATGDMKDLGGCDLILTVTPAQHLRSVMQDLAPHLSGKTPLVICSKGIEQSTGHLMSEVLAKAAPGHPVLVLSGPTFAAEVARGLPAAVTIACADEALAHRVSEAVGQPTFRPYWSDDVVGAQIGGAVKNVLAIACGIADGRRLGENTRAALITRGAAEMIRFAEAKGAKAETLMGLCGIGDLILTCSSTQSRNMSLGKALGEGESMEDILAKRRSVAEGVHSSKILHTLAEALSVDMPIARATYRVLHEKADPEAEIDRLLHRPFARENE